MPEETPNSPQSVRSEEDKIQEIFSVICDITESQVRLGQLGEGEKVKPEFDINGTISKLVALTVYCGMNVPTSFAPSYNRVHADIEYWKQRFKK